MSCTVFIYFLLLAREARRRRFGCRAEESRDLQGAPEERLERRTAPWESLKIPSHILQYSSQGALNPECT